MEASSSPFQFGVSFLKQFRFVSSFRGKIFIRLLQYLRVIFCFENTQDVYFVIMILKNVNFLCLEWCCELKILGV